MICAARAFLCAKRATRLLTKTIVRPCSAQGPLVVFANDNGITKAFRNLPGVEVSSVDSLNLLQVGGLVSWWRVGGVPDVEVSSVDSPNLLQVGGFMSTRLFPAAGWWLACLPAYWCAG